MVKVYWSAAVETDDKPRATKLAWIAEARRKKAERPTAANKGAGMAE